MGLQPAAGFGLHCGQAALARCELRDDGAETFGSGGCHDGYVVYRFGDGRSYMCGEDEAN